MPEGIVPQYLERVDNFFNNPENRVLHIDDIINKRENKQLDYVFKYLLQDNPKAPAQIEVAYFQGGPFHKEHFYNLLVKVLKLKKIWSVNLGEIPFTSSQLDNIIEVLKDSHVTHLFAELEGSHNQHWKLAIREAIRENRKKHTQWRFKPDDQKHNEVIVKSTKNWFNAINHTVNQMFLKKYGGPGGEKELQRRISLKQNRKLPWNQDRIKFQFQQNGPFERGQVIECRTSKLKPGMRVLKLDSNEEAECFFGEFNFLPDENSKGKRTEVNCEKFSGIGHDGNWVGFWTWDLPRKGDSITFRNRQEGDRFVPATITYKNQKSSTWFGVRFLNSKGKKEHREVVITNENMGLDWHFSQAYDPTRKTEERRLPRRFDNIKVLRPEVDFRNEDEICCEVLRVGQKLSKVVELVPRSSKRSSKSPSVNEETTTSHESEKQKHIGDETQQTEDKVKQPVFKASSFPSHGVAWISSRNENGQVYLEAVQVDKKRSFVTSHGSSVRQSGKHLIHLWDPKCRVPQHSKTVTRECVSSPDQQETNTVHEALSEKVSVEAAKPETLVTEKSPTQSCAAPLAAKPVEATLHIEAQDNATCSEDTTKDAPLPSGSSMDVVENEKGTEIAGQESASQDTQSVERSNEESVEICESKKPEGVDQANQSSSEQALEKVNVEKLRTGLFRSDAFIPASDALHLNEALRGSMKQLMAFILRCDTRKKLFHFPFHSENDLEITQDGQDIVQKVQHMQYALLPSRRHQPSLLPWNRLVNDIRNFLNAVNAADSFREKVEPALDLAMKIDYTPWSERELLNFIQKPSGVSEPSVSKTKKSPSPPPISAARPKRSRKRPETFIEDDRSSAEMTRQLRQQKLEDSFLFNVEFNTSEIACVRLTMEMHGKYWCFADENLECENKLRKANDGTCEKLKTHNTDNRKRKKSATKLLKAKKEKTDDDTVMSKGLE